MEDHAEKKRELELAQKKIKEYKDFLKGERRKRLKEKFSKISFFIKLKPWIVWNSILTIMILILFIGAYTSNPNPTVSEENKVGSFLDNIFGFLSKEDRVGEENFNSTIQTSANVEENDTDVSTGQEPTPDEDLEITVTTPEEDIEELDFDIWVDYNGQEFTAIETSNDELIYYVVIKNEESFDIKCEGDNYVDNDEKSSSNVEVNSNDERSIYTKVMASESGNDNKAVVKHEFTCYDIEESIDEGTKKQITVTINFNE